MTFGVLLLRAPKLLGICNVAQKQYGHLQASSWIFALSLQFQIYHIQIPQGKRHTVFEMILYS